MASVGIGGVRGGGGFNCFNSSQLELLPILVAVVMYRVLAGRMRGGGEVGGPSLTSENWMSWLGYTLGAQ